MKKWNYVICGRAGSGKGMIASYLHEKHGAHLYRFSHPLHAILNDMGLVNTRENLSKLSLSLRENFSEGILGQGARTFIEKHPKELVILEWVRRIHALEGWRECIDGIIWIEASPDNRYARIVSRGEKSGEHLLTREEFEKEEQFESENTLAWLKHIANIVIENNGSREELFQKIENFIHEQK
jgi:dephospho-CoA kinase